MITYPTADEIIEAITCNDGSENTLQYCKKGHPVYELYYGQGAYFSNDLAEIFNLSALVDYQPGLNPLFIHLTDVGLQKVLADGCWVLSTNEDE